MNQPKPILCKHYGTYRLLRIYDCMDVSISLNFLVFLLFPRPLLRYMGTFRANPVAIGWLLRIMVAIEEYGGQFSLHL